MKWGDAISQQLLEPLPVFFCPSPSQAHMGSCMPHRWGGRGYCPRGCGQTGGGGELATASPTLPRPWPHPPRASRSLPACDFGEVASQSPSPTEPEEESAVREGAKDSQLADFPILAGPHLVPWLLQQAPTQRQASPPWSLAVQPGGTTQGARQRSQCGDPPPCGHPARQGCALSCLCNPLDRGQERHYHPTLRCGEGGEPEQRGPRPTHTAGLEGPARQRCSHSIFHRGWGPERGAWRHLGPVRHCAVTRSSVSPSAPCGSVSTREMGDTTPVG